MTSKEVFSKAADYLEEHGWCQGTYSKAGSCCVSGAINAVVCGNPGDDTPESIVVYNDLLVFLRLSSPATMNPIRWNDAGDRTAEEVISTLREAAL